MLNTWHIILNQVFLFPTFLCVWNYQSERNLSNYTWILQTIHMHRPTAWIHKLLEKYRTNKIFLFEFLAQKNFKGRNSKFNSHSNSALTLHILYEATSLTAEVHRNMMKNTPYNTWKYKKYLNCEKTLLSSHRKACFHHKVSAKRIYFHC